MKVKSLIVCCGVALGAGVSRAAPSLPELFRPGTTVLFQGDSITHGGRMGDMNHFMGHGYQAEIAMRYLAAYPQHGLKFLNRAVSGDDTERLLARWEVDGVTPTADETGYGREFGFTNQVVRADIPLRPDYLSILVGVNDQDHGISTDAYASNLVALVDRALVANPKLKIVLGEPFRCPRLTAADYVAKQAFVRELARKRGFAFVPYQQLFDEKLLKANPEPSYWSWDGVHPTYAAHLHMADLWIRSVERTYGSGEKIRETVDARFTPCFASNPGRDTADWTVENYENRLQVSRTVFCGEPCAYVTLTNEGCTTGNRLDTSFAFTSRRFPVRGGEDFVLSARVRGTYTLRFARGVKFPCVRWFDAEGKSVAAPFRFTADVLAKNWYAIRVQGRVPDAAAQAEIVLGADQPNVLPRQVFALSDVLFVTCAPGTVQIGSDRPDEIYGRPPTREELDYPKKFIDERGFVRLDGKPFFPIGIYGIEKNAFNGNDIDRALKDLRNAGFNMVQNYKCARNAAFAEFLDAADRQDMKVMVYPGAPNSFQQDLEKTIAAERNRKCLFMWYLADDTSETSSPGLLRTLTARAHKADPTRLTSQADHASECGVSKYRPFVEATDVYLPEIYPVRDAAASGAEVPSVIADMKSIAADLTAYPGRRRSVWPIIQHFRGWGSWKRFPTRTEMRAMTYEAVIHGANGIFFYTYIGNWPVGQGVTSSPERWQEIAGVSRELASIAEDLVCANAKVQPRVEVLSGPRLDACGYESVSVLLKDSPRGRLLLSCNSATTAVMAKVSLSDFRGAEVLFENGRTLPAAASLVDTFKPLEVHVYRLK